MHATVAELDESLQANAVYPVKILSSVKGMSSFILAPALRTEGSVYARVKLVVCP